MINSKTYFVNSKTYSAPTEPARDTVGAIMWDRPVVLPPLARINEAIERLRQVGLPHPSMNSCYVVAEDYTLLGVLGLRDMLLTRGGVRVEAAMTRPFATIQPEDDQELAAQLMEAFDLLELPVVDKDNRLVGVVTADEAMGVLQEEATEDMEMMAAITPSERPYLDTPVWRIFASRIPWLLLLMLSAAFTGAIIQHFEAALAAQVALTAFIPMLMDTGGNCGSQSSVTVIRGLSLGQIRFGDWLRVLWKELRVGLLCGASLAAVNLLRLTLLTAVSPAVAATVSLTLAVTVLAAKLVGCCLPILAKRLGLDPAVMASPFITTLVDAVSLLAYFGMASLLLGV